VENVHWIDPTSEEWLASLVERLTGVPLLLLVTYRPGYRPPWLAHSTATQLALAPLSPDDSLRVVQAVPQAERLPAQVQRSIVAHGAGNPFFLEELVWAVRDHDTPAQPLTLPATVQAVLAARIDRLSSTAKRLLQTAAVIGHDVPVPLLQAVTGLTEEALHDDLQYLQAAEFLSETRRLPAPTYTFKHALTREAAYQSLLASTRRQVHQRIAQVVEAQFAGLVETQPEVIAHHYSRSGNTRKAVEYLQRAGQQAMQRFAYAEAISHCTTALELLKTLPDTVERAQRELVLQHRLGQALGLTKGFTAPEAGRALARAMELCQQVGETSQLFEVLSHLHEVYLVQGKHRMTHKLAEQLLSLAKRQRDLARLATGHRRLGQSLFWLGELSAARSHLEQALALADSQRQPSAGSGGGRHFEAVHARNFVAMVLWLLGYPEQARERSQEARTLARELARPALLTYTLFWAAWLHQYRREGPLTQERAEACMTLTTEHGLVANAALGAILLGAAWAAQGRGEEGIAQMRQGIAALRATGSESATAQTNFLAFLAEAYRNIGQAAEGLSALAEALAFVRTTDEYAWEAELYRLKGELLLQSGVQGLESGVLTPDSRPWTRDAEAEACFRQALEIARRQQARSLELRAAMSLSRLWQQHGKRAEAYALLAEIHGWFSERFDTADLREAKALLEALA
jgi:tetratricopeptide (TPR) repeat protein